VPSRVRTGGGAVIERRPADGPAHDIFVLARIETPDGPLAIIRSVQHAVVRLPGCAADAQPGDHLHGYLDDDALRGTP